MNILIDDQKAFHLQFELMLKLIDLGEWQMFKTSDEALDFINSSSDQNFTVFMGWNNPGSTLQKSDLIGELRMKPSMEVFVLSTSTDHQDISEARVAGVRGWVCKANLEKNLTAWKDERKNIAEFTQWL